MCPHTRTSRSQEGVASLHYSRYCWVERQLSWRMLTYADVCFAEGAECNRKLVHGCITHVYCWKRLNFFSLLFETGDRSEQNRRLVQGAHKDAHSKPNRGFRFVLHFTTHIISLHTYIILLHLHFSPLSFYQSCTRCLRQFVCMYVCMYIRVCVCVCVYVCVCVCIYNIHT